jgi:hypothetical protein
MIIQLNREMEATPSVCEPGVKSDWFLKGLELDIYLAVPLRHLQAIVFHCNYKGIGLWCHNLAILFLKN